jgi:hypothetical protein
MGQALFFGGRSGRRPCLPSKAAQKEFHFSAGRDACRSKRRWNIRAG